MEDNKPFSALFIGLSTPQNTLEQHGKYYKALQKFASNNPQPEAIIVLTALWQTDVIEITCWNEKEPIIEGISIDPSIPLSKLYKGNPSISRSLAYSLKKKGIKSKITSERGIDYGAWLPIALMYGEKPIPVIQLSLPQVRTPKTLFKFGKGLKNLRNENILIIASGNIVLNSKIKHQDWDAPVSGWAKDFDDWIEETLFGNIENLFKYSVLAPNANYAVQTTEHIDPMFFLLGLRNENEKIRTIFEGFEYSTTSLRSFEITL